MCLKNADAVRQLAHLERWELAVREAKTRKLRARSAEFALGKYHSRYGIGEAQFIDSKTGIPIEKQRFSFLASEKLCNDSGSLVVSPKGC